MMNFIEKLHYEDHYAIYNGEKLFFNGCQTKILENGTKSVKLEVYNLKKIQPFSLLQNLMPLTV